jgi:hypothetical protein
MGNTSAKENHQNFFQNQQNSNRNSLKSDNNNKQNEKNENSKSNLTNNDERPISIYSYTENHVLKQKFLEALASKKNNKKHFQVVYMFKKKTKRMFRIDCMTRKINV